MNADAGCWSFLFVQPTLSAGQRIRDQRSINFHAVTNTGNVTQVNQLSVYTDRHGSLFQRVQAFGVAHFLQDLANVHFLD